MDLTVYSVLHVAILAAQAVLAWFGLSRRRLYGFFFAAMSFYQGVALFTLPGAVQEFGAEVLLQSAIITAAGTFLVATFVLAGERLFATGFDYEGPPRFEKVVAQPGFYFAVVGTCAVIILLLMFRNGIVMAGRTWQVARLDATYADSLATMLLFLVFPAAWIALRAGRRALAGCFFAASLILFVAYGTRAALLTLPIAVLLDYLLRPQARQAIKLRTIGFVAVAALSLHVAGRIARGFGLAGLVAMIRGDSITELHWSEIVASTDWSGGEAAIFRYFLFVVSAGPFNDIVPLTSVLRWLGSYVPSAFFAGVKPTDVTYAIWWHAYSSGLFDAYDSFRELLLEVGAGGEGSIHPMIWGEMWVNGGWLALPIFAFALGAALLLIEAVYARVPAVPFVLAAPATLIGYVMVARGNSVIGFGYTAYILPLALVLCAALITVRAVVQALRKGQQR